jgi:hypothetical protein
MLWPLGVSEKKVIAESVISEKEVVAGSVISEKKVWLNQLSVKRKF